MDRLNLYPPVRGGHSMLYTNTECLMEHEEEHKKGMVFQIHHPS